MKIVVVGIGYVGLANAILLSQHNEVIAADISEKRVKNVNDRMSPLVDKEVEEYLATKELNLKAVVDPSAHYKDSDYIVISTPTNYDEEKNYFDTSSVESVIENALEANTKACIVVKSTVPVGYTSSMREKYSYRDIIFSPEFLREGKALYDNLYPSRIIVGSDKNDKEVTAKAVAFANLLAQGAEKKDIPILAMNSTEAEAVKLFANTYLAMRVAYFNELDTYAEIRGLDVSSIINGMCLDPRIGDGYNNPSFGYGGYCLPKDTKQLLANYSDVPETIIRAIVESNHVRKDFISRRIMDKAGLPENKNAVVGVYRLIMKAGSDNFRKSAPQGGLKRLQDRNLKIIIYEPTLTEKEFYGNEVVTDFDEFKNRATVIVANRMSPELEDVKDKIYTRDIFNIN